MNSLLFFADIRLSVDRKAKVVIYAQEKRQISRLKNKLIIKKKKDENDTEERSVFCKKYLLKNLWLLVSIEEMSDFPRSLFMREVSFYYCWYFIVVAHIQ